MPSSDVEKVAFNVVSSWADTCSEDNPDWSELRKRIAQALSSYGEQKYEDGVKDRGKCCAPGKCDKSVPEYCKECDHLLNECD